MRRYKVANPPAGWPETLPFHLSRPDGEYGIGDEFAADLTAEDELANLNSGLLELLPLQYKVLVDTTVHGHQQGDEFELALPLGQEQLLIAGGILERTDQPEPEPEPEAPAPKRARKKKED